jgi:hypothetical protein
VFVFVVTTDTEGGIKYLEQDNFFGRIKCAGFSCFGEDAVSVSSTLVGTRGVVLQKVGSEILPVLKL